MGGPVQGAGLRRAGRTGGCRCGSGHPHRKALPLRQAVPDVGKGPRRHPRQGKLRRRGPECGVPRGPVCGLPLLSDRRCEACLPLRLRPELHHLRIQRPQGRRNGRDPYRHQHRQRRRCRDRPALRRKAGCEGLPPRAGAEGLCKGLSRPRREQDRDHRAGR